ncbi:hypothetical protein [Acidisoma sp.]|uniref:hypothetical protein n=1 Tax=Acidisoma sp. TaxID=1872115 RepID=UPI003AFFBDAC
MLNDVNHSGGKSKLSQKALKVWLFSTLVGTIVAWPVRRLYGINWDDVGYYVPDLLINDLSVLSGAATLHLFLKLHKQQSDFWGTASTYMVAAAAYTPLVNLMNLPNFLRRLEFEKLQLDEHVSGITAVQNIFTPNLAHATNWTGPVADATNNISLAISTFYVVVFAEFLFMKDGRTRLGVYSALACSVISSLVIWTLLLSPLQYINEYSSIHP